MGGIVCLLYLGSIGLPVFPVARKKGLKTLAGFKERRKPPCSVIDIGDDALHPRACTRGVVSVPSPSP